MGRLEGRDTSGGGATNEAAVDSQARLVVRAIADSDMQQANGHGRGFTFHSSYSATNDHEIFYLQNNGVDIHVHTITVSTSASGVFQIFRQTSGTAAGTVITGKNGIIGRLIMSDVTAFGDAEVTGTVTGDVIEGQDIGTSVPFVFQMEDLVIPDTEAIVVRCLTTGVIHVAMSCFRDSA